MKVLYLDCSQGAEADRMASALYELLADREECLDSLSKILPGIHVSARRGGRIGITLDVNLTAIEENIWRKWDDIFLHPETEIISHPDDYINDMNQIICRVMGAFKTVCHDMPEEVTVLDLIGRKNFVYLALICIMMRKIAPQQIIISQLKIGNLSFTDMQIPVCMEILKNIPLRCDNEDSFLCTPVMAAILVYYVKNFEEHLTLRIQKSGYGVSCSEKEDNKKYMAVYLGEMVDDPDHIVLMHANLDDMTGEAVGFAQEMIWQAGALDVYTTSIQMKKNRPGVMLSCICRPDDKENCLDAFLRYTTTLGVRMENMERRILSRSYERRKTEAGEIGIKTVNYKDIRKWKAEYDDLRRIALERGITLREAERFLDI